MQNRLKKKKNHFERFKTKKHIPYKMCFFTKKENSNISIHRVSKPLTSPYNIINLSICHGFMQQAGMSFGFVVQYIKSMEDRLQVYVVF